MSLTQIYKNKNTQFWSKMAIIKMRFKIYSSEKLLKLAKNLLYLHLLLVQVVLLFLHQEVHSLFLKTRRDRGQSVSYAVIQQCLRLKYVDSICHSEHLL